MDGLVLLVVVMIEALLSHLIAKRAQRSGRSYLRWFLACIVLGQGGLGLIIIFLMLEAWNHKRNEQLEEDPPQSRRDEPP
jgi:hypothetical protein